MNIREAILRAADHIEEGPHLWDFHNTRVPKCGTPGCALGWIGFFYGCIGENVGVFCEEILGIDEGEFYSRMRQISLPLGFHWSENAKTAVRSLRLYADKYHPTENRGIPDSVLKIFRPDSAIVE